MVPNLPTDEEPTHCGNCEAFKEFSKAFEDGDTIELERWRAEYRSGETLLLEEDLSPEQRIFLEGE